MTANQNFDDLINSTVYDRDGDKIGSVGQLYLDDNSDRPTWVTVSTGLFGTRETFVPLEGAKIANGEIRVPFEKALVKDAPNVDADQHLSPAEEDELFRHYNLTDASTQQAQTGVADRGTDVRQPAAGTAAAAGTAGVAGTAAAGTDARHADTDRDRVAGTDRDRTVGTDRDREHNGESLVAHSERLNVGTEQREAGKARLRKHVVSQTERVEVPVKHEELRVERESLDGQRATNHTIGEDTVDETVTLHEERPIVNKETVATERVNIGKETVTGTETVQADLKHEEIEVDQDRAGRGDNAQGFRGQGNTTDKGGRVGGDRDADGDRNLKDKAADALDRDKDGRIGR